MSLEEAIDSLLPVAPVFFVDGEERESIRWDIVELPPGAHLLRFVAEGHVTTDTSVTVESGESTRLRIELARTSR